MLRQQGTALGGGEHLAIKASNLRRILPDAKPVLPEAGDADVYPHKFADESWSDDSWDERDPKWRAAVKNMFLPRAVRGQQQARRSGWVVVLVCIHFSFGWGIGGGACLCYNLRIIRFV